MKLSFFIANRVAFTHKRSFSSFIVRVAMSAVGLSVAVMIIGISITQGYQHVISDKFYNCWGNVHITNFLPEASSLLNDEKMNLDTSLMKEIEEIKGVTRIEPYTIQSAILKSANDMEGLMLKGICTIDGLQNFSQYLATGILPNWQDSTKNQILISEFTSRQLELKVGDKPIIYFVTKNESQPKARKVEIVGIFKTGLEDYDKMFALCHANLIQQINKEPATTIQGYEVYISNPTEAAAVATVIYDELLTPPLQAYTIQERFSSVFAWLDMMKINERIIVIIMLIIAVINMITAILILILERTQMIGILKSIGMPNASIRNVFLIHSMQIVGLGILLGTSLGVGLCWLQQKFGIISLNESTYYVKQVPVKLELINILAVNSITFIVCFLLLLIPSYIIKTITPVKALKFN